MPQVLRKADILRKGVRLHINMPERTRMVYGYVSFPVCGVFPAITCFPFF